MESLSSKEFFEQLKTNAVKTPLVIKGIVKKSETDSELLFAKKGDLSNWIKIPSSIYRICPFPKGVSLTTDFVAFEYSNYFRERNQNWSYQALPVYRLKHTFHLHNEDAFL